MLELKAHSLNVFGTFRHYWYQSQQSVVNYLSRIALNVLRIIWTLLGSVTTMYFILQKYTL